MMSKVKCARLRFNISTLRTLGLTCNDDVIREGASGFIVKTSEKFKKTERLPEMLSLSFCPIGITDC